MVPARDLYDLDRVQDSLPGSASRDVIPDFAPQSDRIDLTGIDADTTPAGQSGVHLGRFRGTHRGRAQLGFFASGGNIIVRGSTDGGHPSPSSQIQLSALTGIGGYAFFL